MAAGALTACPSGGTLDQPDRFTTAQGACDALPIFEQSCAGSLCHTSGNRPALGGIDLISPGVAERVLTGHAIAYDLTIDPENCPTEPEPLLDPDNLDQSLLLTKILGTQQCGDIMPPTGKLSEAEIDCMRSWLEHLAREGVPAPEPGPGGAHP